MEETRHEGREQEEVLNQPHLEIEGIEEFASTTTDKPRKRLRQPENQIRNIAKKDGNVEKTTFHLEKSLFREFV